MNRRKRPPIDNLGERCATLALAILFDRLFGEPPARLHPVVWIGRLAGVWLGRAPDRRPDVQMAYGTALVGVCVGATAGAAAIVDRLVKHLPYPIRLPLGAALLKPSFAGRALLQAAGRVRDPLARGDLEAARNALTHLVSRDPSALAAALIAAAAIQSLAENASDSLVAPWLAYLAAGFPGAYAYRAANTLDAMAGYRGRYEHLGKPAARLDDLLNLLPAPLTAFALAATAGPGRRRRSIAIARRDHTATPSPNGGWPMAAMAGALGVRLEKVGHYALGADGRPPTVDDIGAAQQIVSRLVWGAAASCGVVGLTLLCRNRSGGAR